MSEQEFEYKPVTAAPLEPDYVKKLTNEQALVVEARLANESKSTAVAYILWFFLGGLAIHCFYLGKNKIGIVRLVLSLIAWFQFLYGFGAALNNDDGSSMGIGLLLFIILGIWWIIDLFMIPSTIKKHEKPDVKKSLKKLSLLMGVTNENKVTSTSHFFTMHDTKWLRSINGEFELDRTRNSKECTSWIS